jgi:signal transduction histidine kinase/DNA-binding response OmpR family regulator/ligand-binding sensor domain-containing protein
MRGLLLAFGFFYTLFIQESLSGQTTPSLSTITFPKYSIEKYSLESGLSNPRVKCLLEHSSGFLWVGTEFGLNRFDGYEFTVLDNSGFSSPKLSGANISRLLEINNGNILITYGRGRDTFDILNPTTLALKAISLTPQSGFSGTLAGVTTDEQKNTYLLSYDSAGLFVYQLTGEHQLKPLFYHPQSMDIRHTDMVTVEAFRFHVQHLNGERTFWISNKLFGLLKIKLQENTPMVERVHPPLLVRWEPYLWEIVEQNTIYIPEQWALLAYNTSNPSAGGAKLPVNWYAYFAFLDESGGFMMAGTNTRSSQQFDKGTGFRIITKGQKQLEVPFQFTYQLSASLQVASRNFEKYFWLGTYDGLKKVTLLDPKVQQWLANASEDGLFGNRMRGIAENDQGDMVFLPETGAAFFKEGKSGKIISLPGKWSIGRSVTVDRQGKFWCSGGMDGYGLARLDPLTRQWSLYAPSKSYLTHTQTRDGFIWAVQTHTATGGGRLERIDPATGQISPFFTKDGSNPFNKLVCSYLLETPDRMLWAATPRGLFLVDPEKRTFERFKAYNGVDQTGIVGEINVLTEMPGGKLMAGSSFGVYIIDVSKKTFTLHAKKDGLCNNLVCGILPGENGTYWISTYHGLSCFDPLKNTFHNYFEKDGLTNNEFNRLSFFRSADGRYYFGGMNGVNVFREQDLLPSRNETPMFISEVNIFQNGLLQSFKIWDTSKAIILPAENRYLSIKVGTYDLANTSENMFAYRIEGLDKDWVHMGNQHEFRFPLLPPGRYVLRIKSAPANGNWSVRELAIPLLVKEYWYKTWWAYLLYVLMVAMVIWLGWRIQKKRLTTETENRQLKEVDAFKSRFFTNITHEFRTPLTVILGVSEQLEDQLKVPDAKTKMGLIRRNGQNLLRLINEILDLAKLETNSLKLQYIHGDLLSYLKYIAESLHSLSNSQNVMLRVDSKEAVIRMDYDPDRILQIVHNLLSNAIKFTPSGGKVIMRADIRHENLELTVTDTGVGIASDDLPFIFDRYFQAKNQQHSKSGGTGIGLSLTRELVRAMGGDIKVESALGKGSTFSVTLPIRKEATEQDAPIVSINEPVLPSSSIDIDQDSKISLPNILLIEDNPDVVEYLSLCLGSAFNKDFAYNGRAGIEKALETIPDIIISDVMMPVKDGFEVCDVLKNDERTSHIPIVLLTAKADAASRIAGLRRGADAYLSKPFHKDELLAQINNLLEVRKKMYAYYTEKALLSQTAADPIPAHNHIPDMEDQFIQQLRELLEANLSNPRLTQDYICQQMGMSRTNLYRKLMALTNLSLTLYIRDLRLQKAKKMLLTSNNNISEIAYECGFDDPKYFSRVFSEVFGVPPSAWREGM